MYDILLEPRRLEYRIRRKTMERDELEMGLLPGAIRYDKEPVQTSPEDRLPEVVGKIADLDAMVKQLRREKDMAVIRAADLIDTLDSEVEKLVLTAYYIRRLPMTRIAGQVEYSVSHTYKIRREGIGHLARYQR